MDKKQSAYNLVVGDLIKMNNSDIIWRVHSISYSGITFINTNKNDNRVSTMINTIDYYITEPIKKWQEQLEKIGFELIKKED